MPALAMMTNRPRAFMVAVLPPVRMCVCEVLAVCCVLLCCVMGCCVVLCWEGVVVLDEGW